MSRAGISLGGVLASKNRLRFTRHGHYNQTSLNDVVAHNSLNDVLAFMI
jgi:muconolactone delta-isomerase